MLNEEHIQNLKLTVLRLNVVTTEKRQSMLASFPAEWSEVDRRGFEPRFRGCKPRVLPLDEQPICFRQEVRPGFEPDPRPYHGRVLPKHLQTNK